MTTTTTTDLKSGMKIKYMSYGQKKVGVIDGFSRDGSIVFLKDSTTWLHRESVELAD